MTDAAGILSNAFSNIAGASNVGPQLELVARMKHAETANALAGMQMQEHRERQGILSSYRTAAQAGDPNATSLLAGLPDVQAQAMKNQQVQEAYRNEQIARAAQEVLHTTPERDESGGIHPARVEAYQRNVADLIKRGIVPGLAGQAAFSNPPTNDILKSHVDRGMPLATAEVPKFQVIDETVDRYGTKRSVHGFVDASRKKVEPYNAGASASSGDISHLDGLEGKELLNALEPGERANITAFLEGRRQPPPNNPRVPATARAWDLMGRVDPGFDMAAWKTRNAFASGIEARNVTAINTALKHLNELSEASEHLDNLPVWGGAAVRHITNPVAQEVFGSSEAKLKRFNNAKLAVAEELGKAFHGASSVAATEGWKKEFSNTSSPEALRASIATAVRLLEGRSDELTNQYIRGGAGKEPAKPFIEPETRAGFDRLKLAGDTNTAPAPLAKKGDAPGAADNGGKLPRLSGTKAQQDAQYEALNPGETYIAPDGKTRTKAGVAKQTGQLPPAAPSGIALDYGQR